MTPSQQARPTSQAQQSDPAQPPAALHLTVRCHRRLRGPYTAGGALLRVVVPELAVHEPEMKTSRAHAVVSIAPDLASYAQAAPRTLTSKANRSERTRLYSVSRTGRLAHSTAELLMDWARSAHPEGVVVAFRELADADATDRELVGILQRRCDPAVVRIVVEPAVVDVVAAGSDTHAAADLAQAFIDSDGTSKDPVAIRAYAELPADERARRHDARAALLAAADEPGVRIGALPYHLERGADLAGAGLAALTEAADSTFNSGFYEAALDFCERGRTAYGDERPKQYWKFTILAGSCVSYLRAGEGADAYFGELRAGTIDPIFQMNTCYNMAMLYTRHLPKEQHDEQQAVEWINIAIALADLDPEPHRRAMFMAFMRNARALIEVHRSDMPTALALVNEAMQRTDDDLGDYEQLLHRSVLLYNRAQLHGALGRYEESLRDYDVLIERDPDYGDYRFERAAEHRAVGNYAEALADYAEAIRLSLPFHQAHFNRADMLRELGDDKGALADLDYAALLDPTHVDTLTNRADLLLELGELERAAADIAAGLALDPANARLLAARGALEAETGEDDAALASYTAALAADPSLAAAWANRAVLQYASGRPAEAVADLDRAVALDADPALRANRAVALQELGEHERALADLDIAVAELADADPEVYYRRGVSRRALRDVAGAREDWRLHLAAYGPDGVSPYAAAIERAESEERTA